MKAWGRVLKGDRSEVNRRGLDQKRAKPTGWEKTLESLVGDNRRLWSPIRSEPHNSRCRMVLREIYYIWYKWASFLAGLGAFL